MSELNLDPLASVDPNATSPTVADAVQETFFKMKAGRVFIPAAAGYKVGFVEVGNATVPEAMGSVSPNALTLQAEPLSYFLVDEDDLIYCNFADTQIDLFASIDVEIEGVTYPLPWDAPSTSFSDTIAGAFDAIQALVGASVSVTITES